MMGEAFRSNRLKSNRMLASPGGLRLQAQDSCTLDIHTTNSANRLARVRRRYSRLPDEGMAQEQTGQTLGAQSFVQDTMRLPSLYLWGIAP